jgi:8-oxo-dGTP pyrophosphatase MutT (NUDIX family)
LARELREELGINARIGALLDSYEVRYDGLPAVTLLFYSADEYEGQPRNLDFEQIVWELPQRLTAYDFLEGDVKFVARLAAESSSPPSGLRL